MFFSHPSRSQTAETFLLQMAVSDEPNTSDTNDISFMPNEDSEGSSAEILDSGSDADICE